MKKLLLLIGIVCTITSHAQLEKGKKLIGLQFNLVESDYHYSYPAFSFRNSTQKYGMHVMPTYGIALERNWVVGGQATLGFLHSKNEYGGGYAKNQYYDLGIGPFTRLYLNINRSGKLKLYGMAALELTYSSHRQVSKNHIPPTSEFVYTYTDGGLDASLGFGMGYFGNRLIVDMNLSIGGLRMGFYFPSFNRSKK